MTSTATTLPPKRKKRVPRPTHVTSEVRIGSAFDLIADVPDNFLDLIITSPPYWGQRSYGLPHNWDILAEWTRKVGHENRMTAPGWEWYSKHNGVLGLEPFPHWYVSHLVSFFALAKSKLKQRGSLWVNLGDTYVARWGSIRDKGRQGLGGHPRQRRKTPMGGYLQEKNLLLVPSRFAIAMQDEQWILRNDLIWYKPNVPPRPETDRLRLSHEHFFHFVKKPTSGRATYHYDAEANEDANVDVVTYNVRPGENEHTATFPVELIRPRILSSSPSKGWVLDPFCGTGRTLDVCRTSQRNSIGFELNAGFLNNDHGTEAKEGSE